MDIESNKKRFLLLCGMVYRDGMDDLIEWLTGTDFFTAPASTRFHGAHEGGLCEHCLDVYDMAKKIMRGFEIDIDSQSLIITTLFHDLCKVNYYKLDKRNQKVEGVWQEVPYYTVDEQERFGGHGSKSMFLVQHFVKLSIEEASAISNHMGAFPGGDAVRDSSTAYSNNPLAWVLHVADEAATYLLHR